MQITDAGVTVRPLTFHFGVVLLSGGGGTTTGGSSGGGPGGTTGSFGTSGGGSSGTTGSSETGGGSTGGGFAPAALGFLGLLLGGLGLAASAPPATGPGVAVVPAIIAPAPSETAPVVAAGPGAAPGAQPGGPTSAPIVLAASAAQPGAPLAAAAPPKKAPGVVLPYTGANVWLPMAAGSGLIGFGVWLRMFGRRFWEDELP